MYANFSDRLQFFMSIHTHTTPEEFQSGALFFAVRPNVYTDPSRKRSYSKTLLKAEEFENAGFAFSRGRKSKLLSHDNHDIPLPEVYSNTNAKWPMLVAFSNLSGVRVDGKHLMRFQSETRVFKFHWRVDEPQSGIKNQNESYQIWLIRLHRR